ncbi:uncharacterized protein JCM6883_001017 [Sporobolomyces salmoneus]|uniref:uncharacterized protein n=1 Tax=Sporobolomyces salmoneus TaxID=183962 RepID=UPI003178470C
MSHSSDSLGSSEDDYRERSRPRRPRSRRTARSRKVRAYKHVSTSSSGDGAESETGESDSDGGKRLNEKSARKEKKRGSTSFSLSTSEIRPDSLSQPPSSPRSGLTCFLGVALGIAFFAVGGYALYVWKPDASSSSPSSSSPSDLGSGPKTVTVTTGSSQVGTSVSSATSTASSSTSSPSSSSSPSNTSSSSSSSIKLHGLARNNIGIGFLPDYTNQDMKKITEGLGIKSSFYGWYAQLPESEEWDGAQLLSQMDDIKACNCIFQPAVMPTKGWKGLTKDDNFQALAIAKVMKQFTGEGIEVQLRFAHEVNWYQTDGMYKGDKDDFKEGWAAVAEAVKDNEKVKMFFTPNVASSLEDYVAFMPDDLSTVHLLGIDYYPQSKTESFLDHMKPLYDKYCKDGKILFAIGETGNGWEGPIEERLGWLEQCVSAETAEAMPYLVGVSWFNYKKEREFRLFIDNDDEVNEATKKWIAETDGVTQSGATAGNA